MSIIKESNHISRVFRLVAVLFVAVLLAGQIPFTYVYAEGKDETLSANTVMDFEAKAENAIETLSESETAYEQTAALATGDFIVTGGIEGTDYTYAGGVLMILTATPITIKNTDPNVATTDCIEVAGGVSADITLAGVNIDVSSQYNTAALKIADGSTGNVTITLAEGTNTILKSGENCAGLQKNGGIATGTLTINGNTGTLTATGGKYGAGIGGSMFDSGSNITISGGNVTAIGGVFAAGIGGGGEVMGDGCNGSNITISGGIVMAIGGEMGAGIGGGRSGSGNNITISGGIVTAKGGSGSDIGGAGAGIGGGGYDMDVGNGTDITIRNACVIVTGFEDGIGRGEGGSESNITIENSLVIDEVTKKGTVIGNTTLNQDFTVDSDVTLEIEEGASLTVGENTTLTNNGTIDVVGELVNRGTLVNNGTINNHGRIINGGTLIDSGSITGNEIITEPAPTVSTGGSTSSSAASKAVAPKTGDDSNIILWGMIFIFSGLGLCQTLAVWKRREGIY